MLCSNPGSALLKRKKNPLIKQIECLRRTKIKNLLTFDIEEWYHANLAGIPEQEWNNCEKRLEPVLNEILELLKETNNKATFFTVASLIQSSPEIIHRIVEEGHELASHSCSHKMVSDMTEEEFGDDLKRSQSLLSSVTGHKVAGFRAPSWSVNRENRTYVIDFLKENGFLYDSSIFPFKTFLYGDNEADLYRNIITSDNGNSIHEISPSVLEFNNIRVPFSGGFYFRVLPYFFIKKGVEITNKKGHPAVMYLHAHDMDPGQPKIIKGFTNRVIHYTNLKSCKDKLKKLLHEFSFGRMDEYVKGMSPF